MGLERVVGTIRRRVQDEVPDLRGELRAEGADNVVKAGLLDRDSPCGELCLAVRTKLLDRRARTVAVSY